jgi:hypothetical protein
MLIDRITGLPRVQGEDSMSSKFTHFPVMSLECGAAQVIELSSGEMFRVHMSSSESLPVIGTNFLFWYLRSSMASGSAGCDFTWMYVQATIHGSRFIPYRYFSLEFQERRMQVGHDGRMVMIRVAQ